VADSGTDSGTITQSKHHCPCGVLFRAVCIGVGVHRHTLSAVAAYAAILGPRSFKFFSYQQEVGMYEEHGWFFSYQ